jgi:IS4 transposase
LAAMVLDSVLSRFVEHSPITVMAQLALDRALEPGWIDALFEEHRERQYQRELLFSTTVDLMALVAVGIQPSVHAAAQARRDLPVSLAALYDKINNTEPALGRALVTGSVERLGPVVKEVRPSQAPLCPGYRIRVLDGNNLAPSEKRLAPLRGFRGAALPGRSLVVYDPDSGLVTDLVACEDAHTAERAIMTSLLPAAQPGELWIADRNFCTRPILSGWQARGAKFVVREHASSGNPTERGVLRKTGRVETGVVYEQTVEIQGDDGPIPLRRVEVRLDKPTEAGDTVIRILTNLPAAIDAQRVAVLYRQRWTIESMFQWLEAVLNSEIRTLGYPRAALLGFAVAILAFNVLSVIRGAIERRHGIDPHEKAGISYYYVVGEIRSSYRGMMIAVPDDAWTLCRDLPTNDLANLLLEIAAYVDPTRFRKHPRGPKKVVKKRYVPGRVARSHIATARVLASGTPAR